MKEAPTVKIFVSSHKPARVPDDGVYVPIQVGSELIKAEFPGFLRDDEGENISKKNPRFCETTAQYWVWKNLEDSETDYVGFFHYRRYLAFAKNLKDAPDVWGSLISTRLDTKAVEKYGLDGCSVRETVKQYDIVLPEAKNVCSMPNSGKTVREQYLGSGFLHARDLDIMLEVLGEKYPEFVPYAEKYLASNKTYLNNMFIMKRELFRQYSEWLFDILLECDRRIDYSNYSVEAIRTPGHLAERLLNIYIWYIKDREQYKIKELPTVVFLNTNPTIDIAPAFKKNNIAIALSANDYYAPFVATVLASIKANSTPENNYDILIMNKDILAQSQEKMQRVLRDRNNFSLRFIDISEFEEKFRPLFLRGHFTIETWFRLLMPEILQNYDKVLYLDSDLVTTADVAELYKTNVSDYLLAACHDADTAGLYNGFEPNKKRYMDEVLKIKNPYDYFQAGVLLFNLAEFRKKYTVPEMIEFAGSYQWELLDQDVLNYLAQGRVKYIDMAWNVMFDWRYMRIREIIGRAPKRLYDAYIKAHAQPKIIHYAGPDKPWNDPSCDYADIFWQYARESGYYEIILQRMLDKSNGGSKTKAVIKKVAKRILPNGTKRRLFAERLYHKIR